jgi:hypothetical protein
MGELLSARGVQSDVQCHRPPRLVATGRMDPPQTPPDQPQPAPTPLLRPGLADRPQRGRVHRRLQRRRNPLPLPRREHPDPLDPHRQQRLSNGQDTWRAGCVETVRRFTRRWIAPSGGRGSGGGDLGATRLTWTRKREGTTAWRESVEYRGGVEGAAAQGPRDMAKAGLLEAQSPAVQTSHPVTRRL